MSAVSAERNLCPQCGDPIADTGYLCHECTDTLGKRLARTSHYVGDLQTVIVRRSDMGLGGRSAESPLDFDWNASDGSWALDNTVTTWARHIAESRGIDVHDDLRPLGPVCSACKHETCIASRNWCSHPTAVAMRWLATQVGWLAHRPEGVEGFDELGAIAGYLERMVDRPMPTVYAGPCDVCGRGMYARKGSPVVRCTPCDLEYDVPAREKWMLDQVDDRLATAVELSRALTRLGVEVTPERIRKWSERGRITAHGKDGSRPLYRIGDVRVLVEAMALDDTRVENLDVENLDVSR